MSRGLGRPEKRVGVRELLREAKAEVVMLHETKVAQEGERIWKELGGSTLALFKAIILDDAFGGLAVGWNDNKFTLIGEEYKGRHMLSVRLRRLADGVTIVFTNVYGPSNNVDVSGFLDKLRLVRYNFFGDPCSFNDDFNLAINPEDRPQLQGGNDARSAELSKLIVDLGLSVVDAAGCRYTWQNSRSRSRINCFLLSSKVLLAFLLSRVWALPRSHSDHTPLLWSSVEEDRPRSFIQFECAWMMEDGFKDAVDTSL